MGNALPVEIVSEFMYVAPVDVEGLANSLGLKVFRLSLPNNVSGKIECQSENNCTITINSAHPRTRQRFTLAHEIAHYLLHRDIIGDGIIDNDVYRSGKQEPIEREANQYAAEILMPWRLVKNKYQAGITSASALAQEFGVSEAVAEIRLKELQPVLGSYGF